MQIKAVQFYILPGDPVVREVDGSRGGMEQQPQSWTGMFTHTHGLRGHLGNPPVHYRDDKPSLTFRSVLRVVTDGELSAYTDFASGFHADDLAWEARKFMATIAPMLIGVDAFDREHIWQKLWYAQRFFYTGRGLVDMIDTMFWDLFSRYARLPIYKLLRRLPREHPCLRPDRRHDHRRVHCRCIEEAGTGLCRRQGSLVPRRQGQHSTCQRAARSHRRRFPAHA